jgi:cytochrome c
LYRLMLIVTVLSGGVSAFALAEPETDPVARGRTIIEANCSRCHAIGPTDRSSHPQAPPFREVVKRYPVEALAEALAEGIVSGHPDMPVFTFQPAEIRAILAYLKDLR